jgi:ABC-type multidrug transport system ATPase subunit
MIELRDVVRTFDGVTAVDGVSLAVGPGRIVGLLGHNGAGKTTLIRLIAGLLAPDRGTVRFDGLDPVADGAPVRSRLGVLPSSALLDDRLTAGENLRFAGRLFGMGRDDIDRRGRALMERFELGGRIDDRVAGFSLGMKQRLALARVLLPEPEALLLDEPSSAVDPVATREIRELIVAEASQRGTAVLVATHDLDEAGTVCDEVLILRRGSALAQGPLDRVAQEVELGAVLAVRCSPGQTDRARELVTRIDPSAAAVEPGLVQGRDTPRERVPELVRLLAGAGIDVYGVDVTSPSLEDLYFHLHRDDRPPPPPAAGPRP